MEDSGGPLKTLRNLEDPRGPWGTLEDPRELSNRKRNRKTEQKNTTEKRNRKTEKNAQKAAQNASQNVAHNLFIVLQHLVLAKILFSD